MTSKKASPGTPSAKSSTSSRPSLDGPAPAADDVQTTGPGGAPVVLAAPEGPISDSEAKNRREIEAAWLNMWHLYETLDKIPPERITSELSRYAYGPALDEYNEIIERAQNQQLKNTGTVRHRIWWEPPVGSSDVALVIDCLDFSKFGWENGAKKTVGKVGPVFDEYEISVFKDQGTWKVSKINISDRKCSF
ncbi:hypothetical protein [Nakamurella aerolata]|uniref:Uncharacterized protein n=1 Tax=Nakamurella aerolata TaxID=1656892 RepID=A0A849ADL3_9ACTN|nr:hypothetical protein [Nakamurella aerolata]NNG37656.1 hypothetical protein [Nakamurella aerolata]